MLWPMPNERRHVKLFKNGRNQAVRIPRELELPGREAIVYREGHRLVLEPAAGPSLLALLGSWEALDTDWPIVDDPIPQPIELDD